MSSTDAPAWEALATDWPGWRGLGGLLTLDAHELAFQPQALERALGGNTPYRTALMDIAAVEVARKGAHPCKRLIVHTRDGGEARFLISRVNDRATDLRNAVSLAGG